MPKRESKREKKSSTFCPQLLCWRIDTNIKTININSRFCLDFIKITILQQHQQIEKFKFLKTVGIS